MTTRGSNHHNMKSASNHQSPECNHPSVGAIINTFRVEKKPIDCDLYLYFIDDLRLNRTFECLKSLERPEERPEDHQRTIEMNYHGQLTRRHVIIKPTTSFNDYTYIMDIAWTYITKGARLTVDCGSYNKLRDVEQILRFVVAVRYKEGTGMMASTTIIGSNYNVCTQALCNIRSFYQRPCQYDHKWSRFVDAATNIRRVNNKLRVWYGTHFLSQILQKYNVVCPKEVKCVLALLTATKRYGKEEETITIINNLISFLSTLGNLKPLQLHNNTKYTVEWTFMKDVGDLYITWEDTVATEWRFIILIHEDDEMDWQFLTSLIADYVKIPIGCVGIQLCGNIPDFFINMLVDQKRCNIIKEKEEPVHVYSISSSRKRQRIKTV